MVEVAERHAVGSLNTCHQLCARCLGPSRLRSVAETAVEVHTNIACGALSALYDGHSVRQYRRTEESKCLRSEVRLVDILEICRSLIRYVQHLVRINSALQTVR